MRLTRECAGFYRYDGTRMTYLVQRVISEYGDAQWVTDAYDRERGRTEYLQTDTLAETRATIALIEREGPMWDREVKA
jgi:hypothetical protein